MKPLTRALGVLLLAGSVLALTSHRVQAAGPLLTMSPFATNLPNPIGVDAHYTSGSVDGLTVSVNHVDGAVGGGIPFNFTQVPIAGSSGPYAQFGSATGLPDEVCIATVNTGQLGGWTVGDMFVPAGPGKVNRLSAGGALSSFATVASAGATDFIRGDLTFDNTGLFQNSLLAASHSGIISEIASTGASFTLANVGVEVEGLAVIPNNAAYGPWAGKLIATSPESGLVYAVTPAGAVTSYDLGITTARMSNFKPNGINDWESAHVIPAGADFYQVEYNHQEILTLTATQLAPYVGQILLVQESTPAQLWLVNWDPTANSGAGGFVSTLLAEPRDPGDTSLNGNYNFEQGNFVNSAPQPPQQIEPFYTATQGGWGSVPHGNNVGTFLQAHFGQAFPSGVTIGTGGNTATFTSANAIENFLPAGGKFAAPLSGAVTNPTTTTTGVLAAQVLAAELAVGFSNAGITQAGLGNVKPVSGPLSALTINQIIAEANKVLAGLPSVYSRGDLTNVLDLFNNNYDEGTVDKGFFH